MRTSKAIEIVLDILQSGAETTIDLIDAMTSGYQESYRKLKRFQRNTNARGSKWSDVYEDKKKFYALLSHLKSQGFVISKKQGRNSIWRITQNGMEKLSVIRERNLYSKESASYKAENEDTFKIIAYDVPSAENRKRWWLRAALNNLGFEILQKSVWVGKKKLPEEFLNDLDERNMFSYVQIFEVRKSGTLKELG